MEDLFLNLAAISFQIFCETQADIDELGELTENGEEGQCIKKDKYGLSWQVVPTVLSKLMLDR
jgi:predicted 3-demethylubiquinone-9 3-methyltransferase (glyoxalase superfamily)